MLDIYMIAIGGTGMAPLACLLEARGHRVRGVDGPLYPPMSTLLADAGIEPLVGYDAGHLERGPRPDLVIIGNAVPRDNPEAQVAERLAAGKSVDEKPVERLSMPEAVGRFFLDGRRPLVVAGTHGKTTTTAMAATVLERAGRDPGYLVGGVPHDLPSSFHDGTGDRFVIEGDEYNAAYFDRGPKFLHYRPHTLILTSVEHDHVDLYPSPDSLHDAFRALVDLVPEDGLIAACGDSDDVRRVVAGARCQVVFYGLGARNDVHPLGEPVRDSEATRVRLAAPGADAGHPDAEGEMVELALCLPGEHNLQNALGVWAALVPEVAPDRAAAALGPFRGTRRRLDDLGTAAGVTVVDDFAHHPTAVGKTLGGLRQRYPGRRVVVLFEPRSLTAGRSFFFDAYRAAFAEADIVRFAPIFYAERLDDADRLDIDGLVEALRADGVDAARHPSLDALLEAAVAGARPGDVVITMSSGAFGGMPRRLFDALGSQSRPPTSQG